MSSRYTHSGRNYRNPRAEVDTAEDEVLEQERHDRRLRQAIKFLESGGRSESLETYKDHVQKIEEHIVHQYVEEGYLFDHSLYRTVRKLVREQQQMIRNSEAALIDLSEDGEAVPIDLSDDSESVEELLRSGSEDEYERVKHPSEDELTRVAQQQRPKSKLHDRKKQWIYGGPNNDFEIWVKQYPSMLPFGESLHMQEWESRKINYDLTQNAKKDPKDPIVRTNVPYDVVQLSKGVNSYNSGSRFLLPELPTEGELSDFLDTDKHLDWLQDAITSFNNGGDLKDQAEKNYTPRIFLQKINEDIGQTTPLRRPAASTQVTSPTEPSKPTSGRGPTVSPISPPPSHPRPHSPITEGGDNGVVIGPGQIPTPGPTPSKPKKHSAAPKAKSGSNKRSPKSKASKTRPAKPDAPRALSHVQVGRSAVAKSSAGSKKISVKKKVAFLSDDEDDGKGAAPAAPKATKKTGNTGKLVRTAAGHETVSRGSTRSGGSFRISS